LRIFLANNRKALAGFAVDFKSFSFIGDKTMKRKLLLGTLGIVLASVIAFTGCDDILAEIQKGLGANATYGIVLSEAEAEAFDSSGAKPLLVVNSGTKETGTLKAELTGIGREAFVLSETELPSIEAGGTATFTVTPKTGLAVGTYSATVTVSGANKISANFGVSFTVNPTFVQSFDLLISQMLADAKSTEEKYYMFMPNAGEDNYPRDLPLIAGVTCPMNFTIDGDITGWEVTGNGSSGTVCAGVSLTLRNFTFTNLPFIVQASGTLVLDDKAVIQNNAGGGVNVNGGSLVMKDGALIANNKTANKSGGVRLNNGMFTMTGGTISGNINSEGGGVRIAGGTFTMSGGLISDNIGGDGTTGGGGVCLYGANTVFNMIDGVISGNGNTYQGGGVAILGSGAIFNMGGGLISGGYIGKSGGQGGGVYAMGSASKFNMSAGTISGNSATYGGGVSLWKNNYITFTMTGGLITGNTSSYLGGGVHVSGASTEFDMQGGEITGNTAASYGGGLSMHAGGTLSGDPAVGTKAASGGSIYNNKAIQNPATNDVY
jgi:hypothetical protein